MVGDFDDLIAAARTAATRWRAKDVEVGRLEGLLDTGPARLAARPRESVLHHAGYLAGHAIHWMHQHGKPLEMPMLLVAAIYGACLADEAGQRALAKPDSPVSAHLYAAIRTEKKTRSALTEADERMLFGWLLEQTDKPATTALIDKLDRLRGRRQERLGFDPGPPALD